MVAIKAKSNIKTPGRTEHAPLRSLDRTVPGARSPKTPATARISDRYSADTASQPQRASVQEFAAHATTTATEALSRWQGAKVSGRLKRGLGGSSPQLAQPSGAVPMSTRSGAPVNQTPPVNDGAAPGYDGNPRTDLLDAAKVLRQHLDTLDTAAGGRRDGKFGLADLEAVAADPSQPWALRNAAQALLADPNMLNALDVAGGPRVDRTFSAKDLDRVIAEGVQNEGGLTLEQVTDGLGRNAGLETPGREGWSNFDALDAASTGETDGVISRQDLSAALRDPASSPELRELARALLDNDNLFNALDVASGDERDGKFSRADLKNVNYSPTPEAGRQWTGNDAAALDRVLERGGSFDDLYGGVHQTDRGNCASTAVIKAAMDTYGTEVFNSVEKLPNGGYAVEMQDGVRVELSREELEAAATGAHYQGDDPEARAFATLCYAAMAKRAQMMGHEGAQTYAEALRSLANGEVTSQVPGYLGLADKVRSIDVDEIEDHDGVVAWGNGHAVFVDEIDGQHYTDAWGNAREYDGTNEVNKDDNALTGAYYFAA